MCGMESTRMPREGVRRWPRRLVETAEALSRAPGGIGALRWRPPSLSAVRLLSDLARRRLRFDGVLDGGANIGQFSRATSRFFPGVPIVAVEPEPRTCSVLRDNLGDVEGLTIVEAALTETGDGTILYRNEYSPASSTLPIASDSAVRFGAMGEAEPVPVDGATVAGLVEEFLAGQQLLLKLDLQGAGLAALRGAVPVLHRIQHVLLEVAFEATYDGEPLFEEVDAELRRMGLAFVAPLDFLKDDRGLIVQMDALFSRSGASTV